MSEYEGKHNQDLHKELHHKEHYEAKVTEHSPERKLEHLELKKVHEEKFNPQPAQKPSVGKIVHFVLDSGPSKGQHRPAMIVRVWAETCVQ